MRRTAVFFSAVLLGVMIPAALVSQEPGRMPPDHAGYQLLERLAVLVVTAAAPSGNGEIGPDLVDLAKDLKVARGAKRVDDLFAVRYGKLLSAVRQGILRDPEVLYWPMYRHTMMDFIEERTGRMPDWKEILFHVENHGGSGVGLAILADAMMSEIVSLHVHLENRERRSALIQLYMERGMKGAVGGR
jgi:hypothetical protein